MMNYEWREKAQAWYFYEKTTGKIVGRTNKIALTDISIALIYTGIYTFTQDDERHLGQYIDTESAKNAVEFYWDRESRTMLCFN